MNPRKGSLADRLSPTTAVLVVEDEPDIAALLAAYFRASGLGLVHVNPTTADDVLAAVAEHEPACLLLDINLAGLSGLDVLAALRDQPATGALPVLIVSADIRAATRERAEALGIVDFVAKPFSVSSLFDAVEAVATADTGPAAAAAAAVVEARDALEDRLARCLAQSQQSGEPVSFALVLAGAREATVLQALRADLPDAVVGRGEALEIALIVPGADASATTASLTRSLRACGAGVRAGVAAAPAHAATWDQLYMAADTALAEAVEQDQPVVAAR